MAPHPPVHKTATVNDIPGSVPSEKISIEIPDKTAGRPLPGVRYMSAPAYQSPLRHHHRVASSNRQVKETLNARSEYSNSQDDGTAQHRINQYLIKQEVGRGSFGAVHLAVDQFGQEYAVKEFSKSRLRKRQQSNLLRRPNARRRFGARVGFNSPLHRPTGDSGSQNSLDLIREEIAVMKKLNHPNLVSLIEVLDDPEEDSLYMVLELCKKGVVMKVGLDDRADPYDEEQCRCWFRDMILGMEYLHAQGIIHRDIKPDNCLVTEDDVLKIVDFGVSEMFEKDSQMLTAKSAGSPAFMPPELCVPRHGHVSGTAADIWSMGVTLYCLRYGRIPFEKIGVLDLYESIRCDEPELGDCEDDFRDLMCRILEKDPSRRIAMPELREHPWVTRRGTDPLLSKKDNVAVIVEEPTDAEVNAAITTTLGHLVVVVKAVKKFKQLLLRKRPYLVEGILGSASRIVQPPQPIRPVLSSRKAKSTNIDDRRAIEGALAAEGIHRGISLGDGAERRAEGSEEPVRSGAGAASGGATHEVETSRSPMAISQSKSEPEPRGKGQARDPLEEEALFLRIGPSADHSQPDDGLVVSESPSAVDMNVYEAAYQEEIERILAAKGRSATLYLTRRVEGNKAIRENEAIFDHVPPGSATPPPALAKLMEKVRASAELPKGDGRDNA